MPEEVVESITIQKPVEIAEIPVPDEKPVEEKPAEKKPKKIKKKKSDDLDEITRKLLEQEVERAELETYEKIDLDIQKKPKDTPEEVTIKPKKVSEFILRFFYF